MTQTLNSNDIAEIDRIVASIGRGRETVVKILRAIQSKHNYLPQQTLRRVCEITDITPADIAGVSTFYPQFRHRPAGQHMIQVCIGTACHVKGAETVYNAFKHYLAIPADEDTDSDKLFTVERVACLGCCMLAPAVRIDDITYGFLETRKVPGILRDFLASQQAADTPGKTLSPATGTTAEVRLCVCSSCAAGGADDVHAEFQQAVAAAGMPVTVKTVGCTGVSYHAPLVEIADAQGNTFRYGRVQPGTVRAILLSHFQPHSAVRKASTMVNGLLDRLAADEIFEPATRYPIDVRDGPDAAYLDRQRQLVTEHAGQLDPVNLDEYIAVGGFDALRKCVTRMTPAEVIRQIQESGLRGRGGGGFPTGNKWANVRDAPGNLKYIICNADEGDPGAFMDRMILESFPFRAIEGIAIAAYAAGADQGYVYVRAEYPLAVTRVEEALGICAERGIIGDNVMGTDHCLNLETVQGAGAFVCGEETALLAAIQGQRGMPRFRPPYPAEQGLWQRPTLVNNVETLALVPWIIRHGPQSFAALGTQTSKGTKAFALAGKVVRGGLIEVPMGITLHDIIEDIGGGTADGKELKAVQVGGPSGGCVPAWLTHTPVDYDALAAADTMMGSGGLVALDNTDCMVDIARYFLAFTQQESCGKCTPCRVGTRRMLEILDRLCQGEAGTHDIEQLERLAQVVSSSSLCGLGRTAPNPVLSTLKHFRSEYEAHVDGRCPAKKCKALIVYAVTDDCIGCTRCAQRCPADAIAMTPYEKHRIDLEKCVQCDTCRQVCPSGAVITMDRKYDVNAPGEESNSR